MDKGPLDELTEEEMAMVVPVSQEVIDAALEQGRRDLEAIESCRDCRPPPPLFYR